MHQGMAIGGIQNRGTWFKEKLREPAINKQNPAKVFHRIISVRSVAQCTETGNLLDGFVRAIHNGRRHQRQ